jgi:acetyl-CoA C-acetyltransferase
MRKVALVAGGMGPWGVRAATLRDLIAEGAKAAFDDNKNIRPKDIEGLLLSSAFPERNCFQTHTAPLAMEIAGITASKLIGRVELLCGSGTLAIQLAYAHIAAGLSDVIMVVGAEKLYMPDKWETYYNMQAACDRDFDNIHGLGVPPPLFAMIAKMHMKKYGTTEEQMALVSVKARKNGATNPHAHFRQPVTLDEVMTSVRVVDPLKIFDCCPVTDGAAGVILASEDRAKDFTDKPVWIKAIGQASTHKNSANVPGFTSWPNLKMAAADAYRRAGIKPDDVDVAATHDCFTISEIIEYEDFGWCEKGEGGRFIEAGLADVGGKVAVNPDGGLLSCGHPFGATGVRQAQEMMHQLRGDAHNQVKDAKIALQHTLSGFVSDSTIIIYGRDE